MSLLSSPAANILKRCAKRPSDREPEWRSCTFVNCPLHQRSRHNWHGRSDAVLRQILRHRNSGKRSHTADRRHNDILSLQNGVDNPDKLARVWDRRRTLAGVVYVGAQVAAPGVIIHSQRRQDYFRATDGGVSGRAAKVIEQTLSSAGVILCDQRRHSTNSMDQAAVECAVLRHQLFGPRQHETDRRVGIAQEARIDCMAEVQAAARTRGIELPREHFDETIAFSAQFGSFKPSMLQDLEAGKPLEYEAFNGIVVNILHEAGKPRRSISAFTAYSNISTKNSRGGYALNMINAVNFAAHALCLLALHSPRFFRMPSTLKRIKKNLSPEGSIFLRSPAVALAIPSRKKHITPAGALFRSRSARSTAPISPRIKKPAWVLGPINRSSTQSSRASGATAAGSCRSCLTKYTPAWRKRISKRWWPISGRSSQSKKPHRS